MNVYILKVGLYVKIGSVRWSCLAAHWTCKFCIIFLLKLVRAFVAQRRMLAHPIVIHFNIPLRRPWRRFQFEHRPHSRMYLLPIIPISDDSRMTPQKHCHTDRRPDSYWAWSSINWSVRADHSTHIDHGTGRPARSEWVIKPGKGWRDCKALRSGMITSSSFILSSTRHPTIRRENNGGARALHPSA